MPVDGLTSFQELQQIVPAWEDLLRRDPGATPFQSPQWVLPWWQHFGTGELLALTSGSDGHLDALAPMFILRDEDESLGLIIGTGITDYLDVVAAPGSDLTPLVARMAAADCAMWDLQQLRPSSPLVSAPLPDGFSDTVEDQERCPILPIAGAGDDLQQLISPHFRKKLRYYARALEREAPLSITAADQASLDGAMTILFDLHGARWRERGLPGVLADDVIQAFHRDVARRMFAAGKLRMYVMRHGERPIAVFYGFAQHDTVYYYLSGYEPQLEKLSPGTLVVAHAIREAVRAGATTFDFLRGAEDYKYSWGATDRTNRRRQLVRR